MFQLPIQIMKSPGHLENILLKMKDAGRKEATILGIMALHLSRSIWEELAHMKRDLCSFILGLTFSKEKPLLILLLPKICFHAGTVGNLALACFFLIATGM